MQEISTKPYLLRAIYEWCTDNGFTPHIVTVVDGNTRVPMAFVKNGEIVLNVSFEATSGLKMDNDEIRFSARFGGVPHDIRVPVDNVIAIYAQENGQGMAFEVTQTDMAASDADEPEEQELPSEPVAVSPVLSAVTVDAPAESTETHAEENAAQKKNEKKSGKPILKLVK